jgi:hypothetical protein
VSWRIEVRKLEPGGGIEERSDSTSADSTVSVVARRVIATSLVLSSIAFVVALNLTPIRSNDFWIQLKVGDLIRQTGEIPATVLFTYTETAGEPFVAYEWLPSLAWSHAYAGFGYEGMVVLKCLLALAILGLCVLLCLQVSHGLALSVALASACLLGINFRTLLRPETIGLLLGLASLNVLHAYTRTNNPRWLLPLLPISLL